MCDEECILFFFFLLLSYTKLFGKLIMPMIKMSMLSDKQTMRLLKLTSLLYLVSPLDTRFFLTVIMKKTLSAPSISK